MAKRGKRIDAIRQLVRSEEIKTQKGLVELLQQQGFDCTQATVSRDIADMDLVKSSRGFYALREDLVLEQLARDMLLSVEDAMNLVVFKTRPGGASMVAEAIDNADIEGLVGTVAGENTIMAATKTPADAIRICSRFNEMREYAKN